MNKSERMNKIVELRQKKQDFHDIIEQKKKELLQKQQKFDDKIDAEIMKVEMEQAEIAGRERCLGEEYYFVSSLVILSTVPSLYSADVINASNTLHTKIDNNELADTFNYATKNYFSTRKGAAEYAEVLKIKYELIAYAEAHNDKRIDWNDEGQTKYVLYYSGYEKTLEVVPYTMDKCAAEVIAFTSEEVAKAAVEAIGEDRVIKYMWYNW